MSKIREVLLSVLCSLLILAPGVASAQQKSSLDSTFLVKSSAFRATDLIAPGVLIGSGLSIHYFAHDTWDVSVHDWAQKLRGDNPERKFDNYLQYLPLAMDLGMGLVGVDAKRGFVDRTIESSLAHLSLGVVSWTCKKAFHTLRPNEVDYRSFPSGHTDLVFLSAELVRMEYGWGWGGVAYASAATVAFMRLYNNWHWFSDVVFGAGIGILTAHIGEWLLEPTKNLFGIRTTDWGNGRAKAVVAPSLDPVSGAMCATFALNF